MQAQRIAYMKLLVNIFINAQHATCWCWVCRYIPGAQFAARLYMLAASTKKYCLQGMLFLARYMPVLFFTA